MDLNSKKYTAAFTSGNLILPELFSRYEWKYVWQFIEVYLDL